MRLRGPILMLLTLACAVSVLAWLAMTPAPALEAGPLVVEIPAHEGVLGIADRLSQAGVVRSRIAFLGVVMIKGSMKRLKAGEY